MIRARTRLSTYRLSKRKAQGDGVIYSTTTCSVCEYTCWLLDATTSIGAALAGRTTPSPIMYLYMTEATTDIDSRYDPADAQSPITPIALLVVGVHLLALGTTGCALGSTGGAAATATALGSTG